MTAQTKKPPLVVAVASGKGGVGKTNVAVNLALELGRLGRKALVVDCDLGLANADILLGLSPSKNISDLLLGRARLGEVIINSGHGFDLLPASSGAAEIVDIESRQERRLLKLLALVFDRYDHVLFDTGAGISSTVLGFNQAAHENILVLTPEPTAITDAYAFIKVLTAQTGPRRFHLFFNMVQNQEEAARIHDSLNQVTQRFLGLELDLLGAAPLDPLLKKSVLARTPLGTLYPDSPAAQAFRRTAAKIETWAPHQALDLARLLSHPAP